MAAPIIGDALMTSKLPYESVKYFVDDSSKALFGE
jgi:hypothetical protein